jgi:type II secretory pathway pseudopilin PulG
MTSLLTSSARKNQNGFTFVGLILIIISLSLFSAAIFFAIPPSASTRSVQITEESGATLVVALKKYKRDNKQLPPSLAGLVTTSGTPCVIDTAPASSTYKQLSGWCGPYLDLAIASDPGGYQRDGWGVNFSYDGINLKSCGPDLTCGTADDIVFQGF